MSDEDVDRVREAFEAFNRGDFDTAVAFFHPNAEWIPYLGAVDGSIYRGRAALKAMWAELNDNFSGSLRLELEELIDCGHSVVAVVEASGTGTTSGVEVHQRWAQLAAIRDGLVFRVEPFPDKASALEAARMSE